MALIYDRTQDQGNSLEDIAQKYLDEWPDNKVIYLQNEDLYSSYRNKYFSEIVEQTLNYKNLR